MSFNQISGKIHDRKPLLRRTERQNSNKTTIPYRRDANLISQNDSFRDLSLDDEPSNKQDPIFYLPSIRRESIGKVEKIKVQNSRKRNKFFKQVYLQQNCTEEKALSPVEQSKLSLSKMQKKLSLNLWQKRVQQQQQSIIFNYLNEKVEIKKPKKKKKKTLPKSAEKPQQSNRLYVFPSFDPLLHRRQKTEFKMAKQSKLNLGSILQKRRSLDVNSQRQLLTIKRQIQTFQKQTKLLDELKRRVNQVQRYQLSLNNLPSQPSNKKYSLQNRTFQSLTLALNEKDKLDEQPQSQFVIQTSRDQSLDLNRTNRTIEKTPKNVKPPMERKQSQRIITSMVVPFLQQSQNQPKQQNLADTIKYNDQREQKSYSLTFQKQLFSQNDSPLPQEKIQQPNSDISEQIQLQSQIPEEQQYFLSKKENSHISSKIHIKQPSRIPDKSFLSLRTYYAEISNNPKLITKAMSLINSSSTSHLPKTIPSKQELTIFIENYVPKNQQITIKNLIALQNFQIVLQQNQQLYFGQIVQNLKSGLGITIKQNYLYEGLYQNGQKHEGLQITQAGKYIGQFKNNRKHGQGKFIWKNGEIYEGQWINGRKHGHGTWSSPNRDLYVGSWINGKVQGQGMHTSSTGQKYEGSFHEYLKSGWGRQSLPNGDIYEGQFSNGKPHGNGTYTWKQGQSYKGEFSQGFRHGNGILKDKNGNVYKGFFEKQQPMGKCQISFKDEDSYSGEIKGIKFHGNGTLILYEQEQIWKGQWIDEKFIEQIKGAIE